MRHLLLSVAVLSLVACTQSTAVNPPSEPSNDAVTVTFSQTTTEDAQAVPHTKATLVFSGAINKTVDLGSDIQGPLQVVDESTYEARQEPLGTVALVLTSWFAGAGEEIWITQHHDTKTVSIQKRYGGEEGACTDTEVIAEYPVEATLTFSFEGIGTERADQSSLAFCDKQS